MTAWDDWLRKLSADGKGGLGLRGQPQMRAIDRGLAYAYVMAVGMDVSADSFEASIRAAPDAAGATLTDFDVTVGAYAEGITSITLELPATQTTALPSTGHQHGFEELFFALSLTPGGLIETAG